MDEEIKQEEVIEETKQPFEVIYVNQPEYVIRVMWPLIVEFDDTTKMPGMSPHTITAYMIEGIKYKNIEIWVAIEDGKPIGFAVYQIMGFPYYSTGHFVSFYACKRKREVSDALTLKFLDFMERFNLKYWGYATGTEKLAVRFKERAKEMGFTVKRESFVFMGKRKIGG